MGVIVITVHGTNDGAASDSGAQWWQTDSGFCRRFSALGAERGVDLDVRPFHWDGANSDVARRQAGRRLAQMLHRVLRETGEASVVGHSHGGNVIAYALDDPWLWRAYRRGALRIVSVGTPFFAGRRRWVSRINDVALRTILSGVLLTLIACGLWLAGVLDRLWPAAFEARDRLSALVQVAGMASRDAARGEVADLQPLGRAAERTSELLDWIMLHPLQVTAFGIVALGVVLGPAFVRVCVALGVHAANKLRPPRSRPMWRAIAHPADEAIALLAATPRTRLSPMTSSGAARSVRRLTPLAALLAAVTAVAAIWTFGAGALRMLPERIAAPIEVAFLEIAWRESMGYRQTEGAEALPHQWVFNEEEYIGGFVVPEAAIAALAASDPVRRADVEEGIAEASSSGETVIARAREAVYVAHDVLDEYMIAILALATIISLLAVWLVQLVFVALSPILGRGMSFFANRSVTGAMTGAALGEDGEYVLRSVHAAPPARFRARAIALSDATIERMYVDADRHAGESLRRIRRTIDTAPERTTGDAFGDLLSHISWRELIHTSYFESDEVAALVLDGVSPDTPHASLRVAA